MTCRNRRTAHVALPWGGDSNKSPRHRSAVEEERARAEYRANAKQNYKSVSNSRFAQNRPSLRLSLALSLSPLTFHHADDDGLAGRVARALAVYAAISRGEQRDGAAVWARSERAGRSESRTR